MNSPERTLNKSVQHLARGATGWRTCSTRATFSRVWKLRNHIGITRLAELSELDRVGLPVACAVRPIVNSAQVTAAQGKGFTGLQAYVSALMEAAERWAASQTFKGEIRTLKEMNKVGKAYLDPALVGGFLQEDAAVEWIEALSVRGHDHILVPASCVFFPYFAPPECCRPTRPCTSGLASGNVLVEAILHGIFEVVERAATSSAWQLGCARLVPRAKLLETPEGELLLRLENAGARVFVCQLANGILPTYSVVTFDSDWFGPRLVVGGHGAHPSARLALARALAEAAQSRVVALQGSREDLRRHNLVWNATEQQGRAHFEQLEKSASSQGIGLAPSDQPEPPIPISIGDALAEVCNHLAAFGYPKVFYVDLAGPLNGIAVARVIVPGLIDLAVQRQTS